MLRVICLMILAFSVPAVAEDYIHSHYECAVEINRSTPLQPETVNITPNIKMGGDLIYDRVYKKYLDAHISFFNQTSFWDSRQVSFDVTRLGDLVNGMQLMTEIDNFGRSGLSLYWTESQVASFIKQMAPTENPHGWTRDIQLMVALPTINQTNTCFNARFQGQEDLDQSSYDICFQCQIKDAKGRGSNQVEFELQ